MGRVWVADLAGMGVEGSDPPQMCHVSRPAGRRWLGLGLSKVTAWAVKGSWYSLSSCGGN